MTSVVPVMLMGFLVGGRNYRFTEYVTVVLITAGVITYSVSKELKVISMDLCSIYMLTLKYLFLVNIYLH